MCGSTSFKKILELNNAVIVEKINKYSFVLFCISKLVNSFNTSKPIKAPINPNVNKINATLISVFLVLIISDLEK